MTKTRLGRPPDSSSDATRARILDSARRCFAELGYEGATNKHLAGAAGLTTGAIYHYFGSKKELYCDVQEAVQAVVYERFASASAAAGQTFCRQDRGGARHGGRAQPRGPDARSVSRDGPHRPPTPPELRDEPRLRPKVRRRFFGELIRLGVETGEIDPADEQAAFDVISAMMMGLVNASSGDPVVHERTVDGVKRLLLGTFVRPPRG